MSQTPMDVLQIAIARGGHPSLISSCRYRRFEGRPGEIVEKLSPEQRAALRELRSGDVTEGKIGRGVAWLSQGFYEPGRLPPETVRDALMAFDCEVLRIPAPRRMPRHERGQ